MNTEDIIKEIISSKELVNCPLLLSWIQESDENRDEYIAYKNSFALMQSGAEMSDFEILNDLKAIKKRTHKSKNSFFHHPIFRYAAIVALVIIGGYLYNLNSIPPLQNHPMNEVSVTEGNRSLITLPDGSEIILVNGSTVIYPSDFAEKTREIQLEGEAYLTVSKDIDRPFMVQLGEHQIEVLGTEFLVTAYPEDEFVKVDLISGEVKMNVAESVDHSKSKSYLLEPSESLILNKANGKVQIQITDNDFYRYWKEGEYVFKKESFRSLSQILERIYNVSIQIDDKVLESCKFTGVVLPNSTVETILIALQKASSTPFEYKIENQIIYIKQN